MFNLMRNRAKLIEYLQSQKYVKLAYLFGSSAKGAREKLSDVDIGILLDDKLTKKEMFDVELKLMSEIGAILKTDKVDLVIMNDAPTTINYEIIKANRPIYMRDKTKKIDFECKVMSDYLDRRYYDRRYYANFLKKVAKRGLAF